MLSFEDELDADTRNTVHFTEHKDWILDDGESSNGKKIIVEDAETS